jgi:tetratricopeptide (TPR) repeat protein
VNSEALKLGGLIAYQRHDLQEAKGRLRGALELNPSDCEVSFNLGNVHADLRDWSQSVATFDAAISCLQAAREERRREIAAVSQSTADPTRKARQIARREAQIATADRMVVQSLFNSAVGLFNQGKYQDARVYAERVIALSDGSASSPVRASIAERARELLGRAKK